MVRYHYKSISLVIHIAVLHMNVLKIRALIFVEIVTNFHVITYTLMRTGLLSSRII